MAKQFQNFLICGRASEDIVTFYQNINSSSVWTPFHWLATLMNSFWAAVYQEHFMIFTTQEQGHWSHARQCCYFGHVPPPEHSPFLALLQNHLKDLSGHRRWVPLPGLLIQQDKVWVSYKCLGNVKAARLEATFDIHWHRIRLGAYQVLNKCVLVGGKGSVLDYFCQWRVEKAECFGLLCRVSGTLEES